MRKYYVKFSPATSDKVYKLDLEFPETPQIGSTVYGEEFEKISPETDWGTGRVTDVMMMPGKDLITITVKGFK